MSEGGRYGSTRRFDARTVGHLESSRGKIRWRAASASACNASVPGAGGCTPGATRVGLANLTFGGVCGALNLFLAGGLSFALGWHFGWNIVMGHLLGLSTSGIPMSAKLVSVAPHPLLPHRHGGRFGPEQSPLAPAAYVIGLVMLLAFYGGSGLAEWTERLEGGAPPLVVTAAAAMGGGEAVEVGDVGGPL